MKKTFWFCFWLLAGIVVGSLVASVCGGISALSWLAYGRSISFSPAADLAILKFSLNVEFTLNVAEILAVLAAMLCWHKLEF